MDVPADQFTWSATVIGYLAALAVLVLGIAGGALLGKRLGGSPPRQ